LVDHLVDGTDPDWTVVAARDCAKEMKRQVNLGGDPMGERHTDRDAPTVADLTTVDLLPLSDSAKQPNADEHVAEQIRAIAARSPELRARAIAGYSRFRAAFQVWRVAFINAGCDPREADQLATLVAGRDVLLYDDAPSGAVVADEIDRFAPWISGDVDQDIDREGRECLNHLLGSQFERERGEKTSVARAIMDSYFESETKLSRELQRIGLRLENLTDPQERQLLVANESPGLRFVFKGTRWENGGWNDALRYLDGARAGQNPAKFDGVARRYTIIPPVFLPSEEPEAKD
jgi:hypothetical protein